MQRFHASFMGFAGGCFSLSQAGKKEAVGRVLHVEDKAGTKFRKFLAFCPGPCYATRYETGDDLPPYHNRDRLHVYLYGGCFGMPGTGKVSACWAL